MDKKSEIETEKWWIEKTCDLRVKSFEGFFGGGVERANVYAGWPTRRVVGGSNGEQRNGTVASESAAAGG